MTPIANGSFITVAQGEAGLKFTPNAGSLVAGGFTIQESTTNAANGLSGAAARAAITVTLAGPTVTNATTTENTQTTSGLVITPGAGDSSAAYFQIHGITGGTLYQNNGTTPIANGSFITLAQGAAGLKFTPNAGSLMPGRLHRPRIDDQQRQRIEWPDRPGHDHGHAGRAHGDQCHDD